MSKVFVVSDTWFNRPMEDNRNISVIDYNENLIRCWNSVVGKNDIVYVLGGFGISDLYNIAIQLNGNIHFLDNYFTDDEKEFMNSFKQSVKNSIDTNMKNRFSFEKNQIIVLNKLDAVLSYFPLTDWSGKESGTFCFHGLNEELNLTTHSISCNIHKWQGLPVNISEIMDNIKSFV